MASGDQDTLTTWAPTSAAPPASASAFAAFAAAAGEKHDIKAAAALAATGRSANPGSPFYTPLPPARTRVGEQHAETVDADDAASDSSPGWTDTGAARKGGLASGGKQAAPGSSSVASKASAGKRAVARGVAAAMRPWRA
jgi:hypothetical protein